MTDDFRIPRKPRADRKAVLVKLDGEIVKALDIIAHDWSMARRVRKIKRADVIRAILHAGIERLRAQNVEI